MTLHGLIFHFQSKYSVMRSMNWSGVGRRPFPVRERRTHSRKLRHLRLLLEEADKGTIFRLAEEGSRIVDPPGLAPVWDPDTPSSCVRVTKRSVTCTTRGLLILANFGLADQLSRIDGIRLQNRCAGYNCTTLTGPIWIESSSNLRVVGARNRPGGEGTHDCWRPARKLSR
jgi:hypothetical protein